MGTADIDNNIKEVIMLRMAFSAERENDGPGEEEENGGNILGDYIRGLTKKPPQHVNQEFRTALTAEAVRMFDKLHAAWGEKVFGEVIHQLLRSWEDVQVYCYDHHCACPDLPRLLRDGGAIPVELEERSPLYLQAYLHSVGWRGAREERETAQEWEAHRDVRELLARPLVTFVESIIILPPSLREFLASRVGEEGRLPRREELVAQTLEIAEADAHAHGEWLADRRMEAKNLLVLSNMRFAVYKARQCRGRGIDIDDVIQEAALGLIEAADNFEPHRGGVFSHFAARRIRAQIHAECVASKGIVYRSRSVWAEIKALERCEGTLRGALGRTPSPEELGEALSWAVETVKRVQQASMQGTVSIDTVIAGDEDGRTLGEAIADPESMGDVLEQGYHIVLQELLTEALKGLPEREREIVILRHGLKGGPPYTLQQAANILKLTRERVRQLESCGEARLMRIIARRFPHLLPDGMTPELAMVLADRKDSGKEARERMKAKRGTARPQTQMEEEKISPREDGVLLLERAMQWAFLTHTGIASAYYAVLRERALEVVHCGGTFEDVQRALQEKIDALAMRAGGAVS